MLKKMLKKTKKWTIITILLFVPNMLVYASDLSIIPIEYANGDSTLLKSNNEYLLIDVGNGQLDVISKTLKNNGVTNETPINIYISHYHGDHFGSTYEHKVNLSEYQIKPNKEIYDTYFLGYLLETYNVKTLYLPKSYLDEIETVTDETLKTSMESFNTYYKKFTAVAKKNNVNVITLEKNSTFSFGNTQAEVLYLERNAYKKNGKISINNTSLVTMFKNGTVKFLTCGDIQHETEENVLIELKGKKDTNGRDKIEADIFKLNHHGYHNVEGNTYSNTKEFVFAVHPKYFYMQIRHSNNENNLKYDVIKGSLTSLLEFSNMYSNVDMIEFENGTVSSIDDIKFEIKNDIITPITKINSHTVTINYVDKENNKNLKKLTYDFSYTKKYYLYEEDYKKTFEGYEYINGYDEILTTGTLNKDISYNIYYKKTNDSSSGDNNNINEDNNNINEDDNIDYNVPTGQISIFIVYIIGIGMLIYSIFYFKKIKKGF